MSCQRSPRYAPRRSAPVAGVIAIAIALALLAACSNDSSSGSNPNTLCALPCSGFNNLCLPSGECWTNAAGKGGNVCWENGLKSIVDQQKTTVSLNGTPCHVTTSQIVGTMMHLTYRSPQDVLLGEVEINLLDFSVAKVTCADGTKAEIPLDKCGTVYYDPQCAIGTCN